MELLNFSCCSFEMNLNIQKLTLNTLVLISKTKEKYTHEEIKCKLKAGNPCYYSIKTLSSRFFCTNFKMKIYKTIILPIVLYGCGST